MSMFKVAAHTGADNQGWIGYNEETKEITVCLQDEALKKAAYAESTKMFHRAYRI